MMALIASPVACLEMADGFASLSHRDVQVKVVGVATLLSGWDIRQSDHRHHTIPKIANQYARHTIAEPMPQEMHVSSTKHLRSSSILGSWSLLVTPGRFYK
jgi:hypothetical protein